MAKRIHVLGSTIRIIGSQQNDYISLTDMLKSKDWDFFISDWLRNRNTIEFLGIREEVNNPNFNYGEYAIIKNKAGLNNYKISIKEWMAHTWAIWVIAKPGRYGWTYAHKDIAFEFCMWISPKFKVYFIKEFQRLKELEMKDTDRTIKRFLTKMNYKIHTDAIKSHLLPQQLTKEQTALVYADEADVLNLALFGQTAKQRRENNPQKTGNMRDYATIEQLIILTNAESLNAEYIKLRIPQSKRLTLLNQTAISQMQSLLGNISASILPPM
jgi:hypothetical protein